MGIISGGRLVTRWRRLPTFGTFEDKCSTLFEHASEDSIVGTVMEIISGGR